MTRAQLEQRFASGGISSEEYLGELDRLKALAEGELVEEVEEVEATTSADLDAVLDAGLASGEDDGDDA